MSDNDFENLRKDLHSIYSGHPWHGPSIASVVEGVNAATAARRSVPNGHSIWELVLHMTGWTREVGLRLRGNPMGSPPEDWPAQPRAGSDAEWCAAQDELADAQRELEMIVADLNPEDLTRWLRDQREPSPDAGISVGSLIRGLLQHHAYHQGQIAMLKRAAETANR